MKCVLILPDPAFRAGSSAVIIPVNGRFLRSGVNGFPSVYRYFFTVGPVYCQIPKNKEFSAISTPVGYRLTRSNNKGNRTIMKAVLTLVFILFIGLAAQAQEAPKAQKVEAIQMEMVEVIDIQVNINAETNEVTRLYRRPGARVKKALDFSTKYDRGIA